MANRNATLPSANPLSLALRSASHAHVTCSFIRPPGAGLLLVKAQLYYIILHVQRGSRTVSPLPSLPSLRDLQHGQGMAWHRRLFSFMQWRRKVVHTAHRATRRSADRPSLKVEVSRRSRGFGRNSKLLFRKRVVRLVTIVSEDWSYLTDEATFHACRRTCQPASQTN